MITTRDVPTKTPIPTVEMSRSRDWDREKDRGSEPARNDLTAIHQLGPALEVVW